MLDPVLFASFIAATLVIIVTPGPSVALASSQGIRHGPRAILLTVLGDAVGTVTHILIAVLSLNALISLAETLLPVLQIAGGLFILCLAWQSFTASTKSTPEAVSRSVFLSGFFACVTNPKAIVFFVALFPGFISPELNILVQSLIYGAIFVILDAASIAGYALLARHVVSRSTSVNIDKISGIGLAAVGLLLVIKGWKALPSQA